MKTHVSLSDITVCVKGGGDIASGVAWRLHRCGFRVFITEIPAPMAVRRKVSFCEAVHDGRATVEGVEAVLVKTPGEIPGAWDRGRIPVLVDPSCDARREIRPQVLVDATLAKKNIGTDMTDAPLVIGLGPGFTAGVDTHLVVETNRGHYLGRLLEEGSAEPDTGIPGAVLGIREDRVLRAPAGGIWKSALEIGDRVRKGDRIGTVADAPVPAAIDGILRGLIRPGTQVSKGLKIGDIDPRNREDHCRTISDKALAVSGGVLEGILRTFAAPSP